MCNLNIVVKKPGVNIVNDLQNATSASYRDNDDGDGIYVSSNDRLVKTKSKIWLPDMADAITDSEVVICHQRIATSGKTLDNLQPFMNENFVLAHNGVLGGGNDTESDTAIFFRNFCKLYDKSKGSEIKRMKRSIELALKKSDGGSYSIFIYNKKTKNAFYFKNYSPDMHMYILKDALTNQQVGIYLTTDDDNKKFFNMIDLAYEVKSDTLYRITPDVLWIEDDIKEPGYSTYTKDYTGYHYRGYDYFGDSDVREKNRMSIHDKTISSDIKDIMHDKDFIDAAADHDWDESDAEEILDIKKASGIDTKEAIMCYLGYLESYGDKTERKHSWYFDEYD